MTNLMVRRGPDDEGYWTDSEGRLQLGFRRLSILDLTSAGHQPMVSSDGRSVIVFNGEIYNFRELRNELQGKGITFRSQTDTEVLLEALSYWGESAISKLNGMFGFAWYNISEKKLILARDHAGIKPLYYYSSMDCFLFASEVRALATTGIPGTTINETGLFAFLSLHFPMRGMIPK